MSKTTQQLLEFLPLFVELRMKFDNSDDDDDGDDDDDDITLTLVFHCYKLKI